MIRIVNLLYFNPKTNYVLITINPKIVISTIICCILANLSFAHGELTARINEKTKQINKNPQDALLYFERGFLHEQHEDYKKAINDYLKSEALGLFDKKLYFRIGETYKLLDEYNLALKAVLTYKKIAPNDIPIYKLEAQILAAMNKYKRSKAAYYKVLLYSCDVLPEDILEFCDIVLEQNSSNYDECISIIETALKRLNGNSLVLKARRIDFLIASGKSDLVIDSYNEFILTQKRKEIWYFKKAQFLASINNSQEAIIALQQSKLSIQILPTKFKQTKTITNLLNQISDLEKSLNP